MAGSFKITGGNKLSGEIVPQGAKNEALQILCAVLLTDEPLQISNIPNIRDVNQLIEILGKIGVTITHNAKGNVTFQAKNIDKAYLGSEEYYQDAGRLRGSVMLLGPLLARLGEATLPTPGGDKIGRRRLDTHFQGLIELGGEFKFDETKGIYSIRSSGLKGTSILLEEASVTGTANILMAAVIADGITTIYNAACEPYLQQLCKLLNRMGAKISGISSNLLTIEGVKRLQGSQHTMLPDMVEVGSLIGLAAMTRSSITIKNVHWDSLGIIPNTFRKLGLQIEKNNDDLVMAGQENYRIQKFVDGSILTISDAPWPGFTPDLLSIILVVATQAKGTLLVHQKMFESRLFFVDKLIDMGAQIILCDPHRATVVGLNHETALRGTTMASPDIRAGNSLLIAALSADGNSIIHNIEQIDRGYEQIDVRLRALGAQIERI